MVILITSAQIETAYVIIDCIIRYNIYLYTDCSSDICHRPKQCSQSCFCILHPLLLLEYEWSFFVHPYLRYLICCCGENRVLLYLPKCTSAPCTDYRLCFSIASWRLVCIVHGMTASTPVFVFSISSSLLFASTMTAESSADSTTSRTSL